MSSRPILTPKAVVGGDSGISGSMAADIHSLVTVIQNVSYISYTLVFSGTPTGEFTVEVSNDYSQNKDGTVRNPGNWVPLTLSANTDATGSAGTGFIDIDGCAAYAMRLTYTRTSGTGSLIATVAGKVS